MSTCSGSATEMCGILKVTIVGFPLGISQVVLRETPEENPQGTQGAPPGNPPGGAPGDPWWIPPCETPRGGELLGSS